MSSLIHENKIPKRYKSIGMRRIDRWLFCYYAVRAASCTSWTFFSLLFSVSQYFMCVYNNVIENTKKSSRSTRPAFFLTLFRLLFLLFKNPCRYISSSYFSSFVEAATIRFLSNFDSNAKIRQSHSRAYCASILIFAASDAKNRCRNFILTIKYI